MSKERLIQKHHWDDIYSSRLAEEMGWYQEVPEISLSLIRSTELLAGASVIDIGAGESSLAESLIESGAMKVTILDVSQKAIQRSRERLEGMPSKFKWIATDILKFRPNQKYDIWHDRACFHFLTLQSEMSKYVEIAKKAIAPGAYLIIGTFSLEGPEKCSGLPVKRYDHRSLQKTFTGFELMSYQYLDHKTPTGNHQNYIFCLFKAET